jgi:hypothetical protein
MISARPIGKRDPALLKGTPSEPLLSSHSHSAPENGEAAMV